MEKIDAVLNNETAEDYLKTNKKRVFQEMQYSGHAFKIYWMNGKIFLVWKWFSGVK